MTVRDIVQAAAGVGGGGEGAYIEDVFSTYLYTGNGSTQTITNDIDLDGEGGLVWIKNRDQTDSHILTDTERGATEILSSNTTAAEATDADTLTAFNSDGFALGDDVKVNTSTEDYVSWTFRKAPKFFDVVTYTGTGSARTVSHNLGSVPGCIMVKRTDTTGDWQVYHRANTANPETDYLVLNTTAATADSNTRWNDTQPTDAVFSLGTEATVNASGGTYVAYLFAHDAGGFGDNGAENVISCGSAVFSAGVAVNLGWEPQWLLVKNVSSTQDWYIIDNMRSWLANGNAYWLIPNGTTDDSGGPTTNFGFDLTPTGFVANTGSGITYIYIAIRRGPMKTPTSGTEVFQPVIYTGDGTATRTINTTITPDGAWFFHRSSASGWFWFDRLRGNSRHIPSQSTNAESSFPVTAWGFDIQNAVYLASSLDFINGSGSNNGLYAIRRAPGFFDEVCYTGTGSATTFNHNLGVVPELIIVKNRSQADAWQVYAGDATDYLVLNTNAATADNVDRWNDTAPTASVFTIGTAVEVNTSTENYIAYLFASRAGVSKVGTYTGTGTTLAIDCGFSAGARFVMIKRTDSTGDWYVWDSARGIVAGDDPYQLFNSANVEVTNTDYVDTSSAGFEITSTAPDAINADGGTFIFLAIA